MTQDLERDLKDLWARADLPEGGLKAADQVRRRARTLRARRNALIFGGALASTALVLGGALVAGNLLAPSPAPAETPSQDATVTAAATDPEPSPSDEASAPYGFAPVSGPESFSMIPGEGWWNMSATEDSYDDPRQLHNPDTLLVAGWSDTVLEGYQRDPSTGEVRVITGSDLPRVPIDPNWPDEWIILDANTFEVLDTLIGMGAPGDTPTTPQGYEQATDDEAAPFIDLGARA